MAESSRTLARIQGQGLVETTTRDVEIGGSMLASTPAGAMEQARGPDSAKMAGTAAAKTNALRVAIQDVGSQRLSALREMAKPDMTMDQRVAGIQKVGVLSKLDEAYSVFIDRTLQASFTDTILKKENQGATLKAGIAETKEDRDKLLAAIGNINTGNARDDDVKLVNGYLKDIPGATEISLSSDVGALTNAQTIANNLFESLTGEQMAKAFGDAVAGANAKIQVDEFLASTDASAFAEAQGFTDIAAFTSLLTSILPEGARLGDLSLADLRREIQNWKQEEFKDVTEYQRVLQDPNSSQAQLDLATDNLRRLGKVGVFAIEQKVGNLDAQMQDGDTVSIDNEVFKIEEFFTDPSKLAELQGWLGNPDSAPPTLKAWIESNRDAILNKIKDLTPDFKEMATKAAANLKAVELAPNVNINQQVVEEFFGADLFTPTLAAKTFASDDMQTKYNMLQDKDTGPAIADLLQRLSGSSATLVGSGLDGKDIFGKLTTADLNAIIKDGVPRFINNLLASNAAKNFSSVTTVFTGNDLTAKIIDVFSDLGMDDTGILIGQLAAQPNLNKFKELFAKDSLLRQYINSDGSFNTQKVKDTLSTFGNSSYTAMANNSTKIALIKDIGALTNAMRAVPAPQEQVIDSSSYEKILDEGVAPGTSITTIEGRLRNYVGNSPKYELNLNTNKFNEANRSIDSIKGQITSQGYEVDHTYDDKGRVIINVKRRNRGKVIGLWTYMPDAQSDRVAGPNNNKALEKFPQLKNLENTLRVARGYEQRIGYYRDNMESLNKKFTDKLNKFTDGERKKERTRWEAKNKLYNEFIGIWS